MGYLKKYIIILKPSWSTYYKVNPISQHESVMNITSFRHSYAEINNNPEELDKENENFDIMSKSVATTAALSTNNNTNNQSTFITTPPPLYNKIINQESDVPISSKFNLFSYSIQALNNNNNVFNKELKNLYAEIEISK